MKNKDMVAAVLHDYEAARNSDTELALLVWWCYFGNFIMWYGEEADRGNTERGRWVVPMGSVRQLPSEDKLSRIRRKLNECGLYPATDPVVLARRAKQERITKTINTEHWANEF